MSARLLEVKTESIKAGLDNFQKNMLAKVAAVSELGAKQFEEYAKKNKIWENRTSDAWKYMTGAVTRIENGFRINLSHGVDYGIWLELAKNKKYAILEPTVRLMSPNVLANFKQLLS